MQIHVLFSSQDLCQNNLASITLEMIHIIAIHN